MAFPSSDPSSRSAANASVRFGVFEADLRAAELRRNGIKIRIQDLPFRALTLLLARPGEIISREEFRRALWPEDVFVDFDQAISSAIRRLRDALGDSAENPIFIETVERRGYRWIAPVHRPEPVRSESATAPAETATVLPASQPPVAPSAPPRSFPWRYVVYALPLLVLLFALWIFRPVYRRAQAGFKPKPSSALGLHHTANREAEDFYLKGRFYWNKRTPESLNEAVDSFTQAIVHDPGYADAYVGLADCYNLLREFSLMPASEAYPRALAAAKKAVELDDRSSEAHASLAFVLFYGTSDAGSADQEFRRSLELDPGNAKAHHWYAGFLSSTTRFDESLREINRAQALDPNSRSILADKGRFLWIAGHRDESLALLKQLEATEPDFISTHRYLKLAYLELGNYPSYLSEMKKEAVLLHDDSAITIAEAAEKGFAAHGANGMFLRELEEQKKLFDQGKFSPCALADTYARLGYQQKALDSLEACVNRHDEPIVNIAVDPAYKDLRRLPGFRELLAKMGLPQTS